MLNTCRFIDITLPFSERLPVWPGDTPVTVVRSTGTATVSELRMSSHVGTHVDAPAHFLPQGMTLDQLPLDVLIGPAWVAHVPRATVITADMLDRCHIPAGVERLLLRTDNSVPKSQDRHPQPGSGHFNQEYVALDPTGGGWLLEKRIRLIGIDGPSVDPFSTPAFAVHRMLLANQVVLVENLALADVKPGSYRLICLPLRYEGGDGAPARVVLEQSFRKERKRHDQPCY
jgi:arylformamidase